MRRVDVTTWSLEMRDPSLLRPAGAPKIPITIEQAVEPQPELNRFLYTAVGGDWYWLGRLPWTYERWTVWLDRPEVETWVARSGGSPAGYFELERQDGTEVEIAYFGLMPQFIGRGAGGHLLTVDARAGMGDPGRPEGLGAHLQPRPPLRAGQLPGARPRDLRRRDGEPRPARPPSGALAWGEFAARAIPAPRVSTDNDAWPWGSGDSRSWQSWAPSRPHRRPARVSGFTYVKNSGEGAYFKVPDDWKLYKLDPNALPDDRPFPDGADSSDQPTGPWRVVFDSDAKPDVTHFQDDIPRGRSSARPRSARSVRVGQRPGVERRSPGARPRRHR